MKNATLLLDLGNTHLHWGLCDTVSQKIFASGIVSEQAWSDLISSSGEFTQKRVVVDEIWLCSVAKTAIYDSLLSWLALSGIPIQQAKTAQRYNQLVNNYESYAQLGIDRWLGLIGLINHYGYPAIFVDAGTAMTLDYIDCNCVYQGGWIVPGIGKSKQCLTYHTNLLSTDSALPKSLSIAKNTMAGIDAGLLAAALGSISQFEQQVNRKHIGLRKVITGGEGALLLEHLTGDWQYDQHLVLKGLALYAQANKRISSNN